MLSAAAGEAALGGGSIFGKLDPSGTGLMGQKPDTHFEHNPPHLLPHLQRFKQS